MNRITQSIYISFIAVVVLLAFIGCKKEEISHSGEKRDGAFFFDLKGYFSTEADLLSKRKPQGVKFVLFQGNSDTIYFNRTSNISFGKELKPFINSDINRLAWRDKYQVDSIFVDGYLKELRYKATDESLKTRQISIFFNKDALHEIRIENEIKSVIAKSVQELVYRPKKGYAIAGYQKIRLGQKYFFDIDVLFSDYK